MMWYEAAAEQGNADAQADLGCRYEKGYGVPQSCAQGLKGYGLSAEQGHSRGEYFLGGMYERGRGGPQSYGEAMKGYQRAAEHGNVDALFNLAHLQEIGKGAPQSREEALERLPGTKKESGDSGPLSWDWAGASYTRGCCGAADEGDLMIKTRCGRGCVLALVLGFGGGGAWGEQPMGAEAGWAAFTRCATVTDDAARHACTDQVLRDAGLLPSAEMARRKDYGLPRPAEPLAPPKADARQTDARPASKKEDKLETTLSAVRQSADGRLVLTTQEGAIWRQSSGSPVSDLPRQGDTLVVSHGALGSFWCQIGKWTTFRCSRQR